MLLVPVKPDCGIRLPLAPLASLVTTPTLLKHDSMVGLVTLVILGWRYPWRRSLLPWHQTCLPVAWIFMLWTSPLRMMKKTCLPVLMQENSFLYIVVVKRGSPYQVLSGTRERNICYCGRLRLRQGPWGEVATEVGCIYYVSSYVPPTVEDEKNGGICRWYCLCWPTRLFLMLSWI